MSPAEGQPELGEPGRLPQSVEREGRAAVVGEVDAQLVSRVAVRHDREHRGDYQDWRLRPRVRGADEDVHARDLVAVPAR